MSRPGPRRAPPYRPLVIHSYHGRRRRRGRPSVHVFVLALFVFLAVHRSISTVSASDPMTPLKATIDPPIASANEPSAGAALPAPATDRLGTEVAAEAHASNDIPSGARPAANPPNANVGVKPNLDRREIAGQVRASARPAPEGDHAKRALTHPHRLDGRRSKLSDRVETKARRPTREGERSPGLMPPS